MNDKLARLIYFLKSVAKDENHLILRRRYRYHLKAWYEHCMTDPWMPPHLHMQPNDDEEYDYL